VVIKLDASTKYQTMRGWESTAYAAEAEVPSVANFAQYKAELPIFAVDSLGLNRLRLTIRSGAENPRASWTEFQSGRIDAAGWKCLRYAASNDNADPNTINPAGFHFEEMDERVDNIVLPIRQRLQARGEKLFLNLTYVAFDKQCPSAPNDHQSPAEYAEFVLATLQHLKQKYNLVPDTWEVILEPENTITWRGPQIGQAIVAAAKRVQAAGFNVTFVGPSNTNMASAISYFDSMVQQVPASVQYVSEFAYHRYSGVSMANLQTIAGRRSQYGLATAMLEKVGADYQTLHEDLTVGNNSAWAEYGLAGPHLPDNGANYLIVQNGGLQLASRAQYLRQYFRWVRLGAVRIAATSSGSSFSPVAFVNTDGKTTVVVKAGGTGTIGVDGLPAGTYDVDYTTSGKPASGPPVTITAGQQLQADIPASGVITIHRR
jgi:hypothetical protein